MRRSRRRNRVVARERNKIHEDFLMTTLNRCVVALLWGLGTGSGIEAATATEANRVVEFRFESAKVYADPFAEVRLDAIFTDPTGVQRRVPAFWAGGQVWKVRYSSAVAGTHRFQSECSDTSNAGLHAVRGEVVVSPYTGSNALYRHGGIQVAADRRHFAHADGTPFFWLGDTWWMGLVKRLRWPEDFQALTADRKAKGFSVIQIVAGLYPDMPAFDERGLGDGGMPWERLYARIRPEYFDEADKRIEHLVEQGLVPCILGAWGYHLPWLGREKMEQHWRYLIARWGAWPVVWVAAGEQAMPWYLSGNKEAETEQLRREWTQVIRTMRAQNAFGRMVTAHPRSNARDEVIDPALLDFEMQQTGHGQATERHAAKALQAWERPPVVPVISGESRYEALEIKPPLGTREAREAFWAHLLYSGVAGHTYGANGIWQVNLPEQRFGKSPTGFDWGGTPWREAMKLPGSTQLSQAKQLLLTLPWQTMEPAKGLSAQAMAAALSRDRRFGLLYFTAAGAVEVDWARFAGRVRWQWFDPTSGERRASGRGEAKAIEWPGKNQAGDMDWVLVVQPDSL